MTTALITGVGGQDGVLLARHLMAQGYSVVGTRRPGASNPLEPYLGGPALQGPKRGFTVPLATWLRGPLREQVTGMLRGPTLRGCGLFDLAFAERLCERHMSGRGDHGQVLWSLLCFDAFLRREQEPDLRH